MSLPDGYNSYLYAKVLLNRILNAKNKKEVFEALGIETEKDVQNAMDLFQDTFTNEELKTYAIVTLILALILV